MFDSSSADAIDKIKKAFLDQQAQLEPKVSSGNENLKPVDLITFTNVFNEKLVAMKPTQKGQILIKMGEKNFQLNTSQAQLAQILSILSNDNKDTEWIPPSKFKKDAKATYEMLSNMLTTFNMLFDQLQKVGVKFVDLNYSMNKKKYITTMSIDEAFAYIQSFQKKNSENKINEESNTD